ncbi:MAG: hypothetical protein PVJ67_07205 [Candidatus Pacearchaeota archaeon]|jgi:hypothetical protein
MASYVVDGPAGKIRVVLNRYDHTHPEGEWEERVYVAQRKDNGFMAASLDQNEAYEMVVTQRPLARIERYTQG